jgi:anti-sigma regulatory factor (Ser/Thr protein kinase)
MNPTGGHTGQASDGRVVGIGRPTGTAGLARAAGLTTRFSHVAGFWSTSREYAEAVGGFIKSGLDDGSAVMVAVPQRRAVLLRDYLDNYADRVTFADMSTLGGNPARIIPAIQAFCDAHRGRQARYVGEPLWPSRTAAEVAEAMGHEALLNLAFAGQHITILCPYDTSALGAAVLADAEQTHPTLLDAGAVEPSAAFDENSWRDYARSPLPQPPPGLQVLTYRDEPGRARTFVRELARAAGLPENKITDLVIAVGELAANTLQHTDSSGTLQVWVTPTEVICEVRDGGYIEDPLAGRRCSPDNAGRGHGLWVVHQVCDLVEMRTGTSGTTFRLHMKL